ncbi:MAG: hypothetical protein F6J97_03565 [Leptolyngbya sp. SIO4C1]|nr:hypothetical protein [Leptolyngbya sp. SIO4C1]
MRNFQPICDRIRWPLLPMSMVSTLALLALPAAAANDAFSDDNFFACTADLLEAEIDVSAAAAACSSSRYPEALGACVLDVADFTGIAAADALSVCQRSRQPTQVADCTIDIHDSLLLEPRPLALEYCGRSLLPERYATCVIDLSDAAELDADETLTRCIRSGYRPWEVAPRL